MDVNITLELNSIHQEQSHGDIIPKLSVEKSPTPAQGTSKMLSCIVTFEAEVVTLKLEPGPLPLFIGFLTPHPNMRT